MGGEPRRRSGRCGRRHGVDGRHPELAGRIVPGHDFVGDDADPQDGHGHGTHVAGTIAAAENSAGVIGVAPQALVMPLRVLDDNGGGSSADVAAAIAYAGNRGCAWSTPRSDPRTRRSRSARRSTTTPTRSTWSPRATADPMASATTTTTPRASTRARTTYRT